MVQQQYDEFWRTVRAVAAQAAREAAPAYLASAITTGDPPENVPVGSVTTRQVKVWLNGAAQTSENKVAVALPYGAPAPGPGELWLVLLYNYEQPGVLLLRLA